MRTKFDAWYDDVYRSQLKDYAAYTKCQRSWNAALNQVLDHLYEQKTFVEAADQTDSELTLLIEHIESLRK